MNIFVFLSFLAFFAITITSCAGPEKVDVGDSVRGYQLRFQPEVDKKYIYSIEWSMTKVDTTQKADFKATMVAIATRAKGNSITWVYGVRNDTISKLMDALTREITGMKGMKEDFQGFTVEFHASNRGVVSEPAKYETAILPFVDLSMGPFGLAYNTIAYPEHRVRIGDTWTHSMFLGGPVTDTVSHGVSFNEVMGIKPENLKYSYKLEKEEFYEGKKLLLITANVECKDIFLSGAMEFWIDPQNGMVEYVSFQCITGDDYSDYNVSALISRIDESELGK